MTQLLTGKTAIIYGAGGSLDDAFRPFKIDVMRIDGRIAEITTFDGRLAEAFGLPLTP